MVQQVSLISESADSISGNPCGASDKYLLTFALIACRRLPVLLPEVPSNLRAIKAQLTIRMWYALCQICLYRPFVHHLSRDTRDPSFDNLGYQWGSSCVKAAMQAVWVIEKGENYGLFHEAHFGALYTLCFSAAVLIYFVTSSQQQTTIKESAIAACKAIEMLRVLGQHNLVARRCSDSLSEMMDGLPVSLQSLRGDEEAV